MAIQVTPVQTRCDMRRFLEFPYAHYRNDPNWVAPLRVDQKALLNSAKHPFYRHAAMRSFLACSDGKVVGRISAIVDHEYRCACGDKVGTFGFFESVESQDVADALFGAARAWLSSYGCTVLRGPMSPSINYECGLLTDGFQSPPCVMMTYNPPFYARLFAGVGLRKARDLYAYRIRENEYPGLLKRLKRTVQVHPDPGVRIRPLSLRHFHCEVEHVWRIYSSAWSRNWGAAPMSFDEILDLARQLKPILIPELALFIEVAGQPVGFGLIVPDINRALKHARGSLFPSGLFKILYHKSKIRSLRVLALGLLEDHRDAGVAGHLYYTLLENACALGYREAECSWIVEDNRAMNRSLQFLGAERYKTYRIYEDRLAQFSPDPV